MNNLTDIDPKTISAVHAFMEAVANHYDMIGAILFGSRARKSHRPDSDADVAVLLHGPGKFVDTKLAMDDLAYDVLLETGIRMQRLVKGIGKQAIKRTFASIDKFHVVRMANDAMERARKRLRERLTPKERRGLTHDRFTLLKRERDLNDKERLLLSGWVRNYSELGEAHRLKEDFFAIYDA